MLTLGGQVEADMPIIMHGAVELAVTDLAEVEGAPVVQLLAVGVVAYLCGKGWGGGGPKALWYTGPLAALHVQPSMFQRGLCLLIYSSNVSQAPTRCPFWGLQRQQSPARKKQRQVNNHEAGTPRASPGTQAARAPKSEAGAASHLAQLSVFKQNASPSSMPRASALNSMTCAAPEQLTPVGF